MGYLTGLIGAGIGASLSPALHEREAGELGLRYVYRLIDLDRLGLPPSAVGTLLRQAATLGYNGLNITYPCKQLILDHLDEISAEAAEMGAVNTVTLEDGRAVGHNTDWSGFAAAFARRMPGAGLGHVVLLGAGGAGSAIAYALRRLGVGRLTVIDVDPGRSGGLARRFAGWDVVAAAPGDTGVVGEADGVVNASPIGMLGHPGVPLDPALLHPRMWVADAVYRPIETELLSAARKIGCRTLDGGGMAVCQAADALRLFTGVEPDVERMLRHFATVAVDQSGRSG